MFWLINIIQPPTAEDVEEVLKQLDQDGDGKLSIDELQALIVQVLKAMVDEE
jgi:calmodulin